MFKIAYLFTQIHTTNLILMIHTKQKFDLSPSAAQQTQKPLSFSLKNIVNCYEHTACGRWMKYGYEVGRMTLTWEKLMYCLRNLSQCHFVQHTSQTDWPGIIPSPLECSQCAKLTLYTLHKQLLMKGSLYSLSTSVLEITLGAFQKR
jgi:hypothetical protein